jgi:thioredoxin reductase (NADPH)
LEHIPVAINGKKLVVESIATHKQQTIPFDKIVVQYGQTVKQDIFNTFGSIKLVNTNRIEVAGNQLTNLKNIYAIGDVCFYKDKPSSLICAHGEAAVAIRSIINDLRQYDKK